MQKPSNSLFGFIITLLGAVCWGFSSVCGQYLFTRKGVSVDFLITWRLLMAGGIMLAWCAVRYRGLLLEPFRRARDLAKLLLFGIFGISLCQYSYFRAVELSNAPVATTITYTAPVFLLALVCIRERRAPRKLEVIALSLAMCGVFLLATHGSFSSFVIPASALIWALISAVCVVIYTIAPKLIDPRFPITLSLALGMVIGGVLLGLCVRVWHSTGISDLGGLLGFLSVTIIGTIVAFSLYLGGVLLIGPAKAAIIACIEPVVALFFSSVWLGTPVYFADCVGIIFILLCVFLLRKV